MPAGRPQKRTVDIGLHALSIHLKPGQKVPIKDIADVCECSRGVIDNIYADGMEKIRQMNRARELLNEFNE